MDILNELNNIGYTKINEFRDNYNTITTAKKTQFIIT
jgi:hypothetical protein